MHEHRIVHGDFLEQNSGINIQADTRTWNLTGLRDLATTQYAIYDFDCSFIYPYETVLESVRETRPLHFRLRCLPPPSGPYNPFQADIAFVGMILQGWVRVRRPLLELQSTLTSPFTAHRGCRPGDWTVLRVNDNQ